MKKVGHNLRRAFFFATLMTIFCMSSIASSQAAGGSVTLLPPVDNNGALCSSQGLLQWGGASGGHPINCTSQLFGSTTTRSGNGNAPAGNIFQTGVTNLNGGLTVSGNGSIMGTPNGKVSWLLSDPNCAHGGNVTVDAAGDLHCCPLGQVATGVLGNNVICGTLN